MASDEPDDRKLDLGDELELSSIDDEQERLRQRQLAAIPGRAKPSRVVRKVILGRGVSPDPREPEEPDAPDDPPPPKKRVVHPDDALPDLRRPTESEPEAPAVAEDGQDEPVTTPAPAEEPVPEAAATAQSDLQWDEPESGKAARSSPAPPRRRRRRRGRQNAEAEWTGSRGTLWWVLAGLCCVTLIGFFLRYELKRSGTKAPLQTPYRPPVSGGLEETPIASFVKQSADLVPVVLEVVTAAESAEGKTRADLYRRGAESVAKMDDWNRRVPALAAFNQNAQHDLHASVVMKTPYLTLEGWRADYTKGLVFFVARDDDYLLDWEATAGYSEVLPAECEALADEKPRLMRCIVGPSLYYTDLFPEDRYLCYALHHRDPAVYVWAYVERGTKAATAMEAHLSFNMRPPVSGRAAVMVRRGPAGARPRQMEVTEFLYSGWVAPESPAAEELGSGLEKAGGE